MNTNSIVLIVIAVVVALVLAGVVVFFSRKFRAERRLLGGATLLGEMAAGADLVQREDDLRAQARDKPGREV